MRMHALLHRKAESDPPQPQPAHFRNKVVCIYCYRILGATASAQREAQLRHKHDCIEERLVKAPAAPPPFN
jgi:hypothetical protein